MSRAICIAAALFVMTAGQAWADLTNLVGVNFAGSSPTKWTRISSLAPSTINNLIDETGAATGVSITFSAPNGGEFASDSFNGLTASTVPIHTPSLAALNGNFNSTNSNAAFDVTLGGLTPESAYEVWIFAARFANSTSQTVTITGEGTPTTFSQNAPARSLVVNSMVGSDTEPLSFYAVPIESDASGTISIAIAGGGHGFAVTGIAIQGVPVPEPASFALVGLGLAGMAGHAWRRRRGGPARA